MQVFVGKPLIVHRTARSRVRPVHLWLLCLQFGPSSHSSLLSYFPACRVHELPSKVSRPGHGGYLGISDWPSAEAR